MSLPDWLPNIIPLSDYGGNWNKYLDAIYTVFKNDFIDEKPEFRGKRLGLKRHPISAGKEATFWHFISEGENEEGRLPDFTRCERIAWPKPMITNESDDNLKVWKNKRGGRTSICIWLESEQYLVILADRGDYILPWTAYCVERAHQQRKLMKEYQKYQKSPW